jgi:hypothetical protein
MIAGGSHGRFVATAKAARLERCVQWHFAMNLEPAALYCQACHQKLYSCFTLSSGQPVIAPASSEVPYFHEGASECPFCSAPMHVELNGAVRYWWKNERTGKMNVA